MPSSISLAIAGRTVTVTTCDPRLQVDLTGPNKHFLVADEPAPDLTLSAAWDCLAEPSADQLRFESNGLWRLYAVDTDHVFCCYSPRFGRQPYKIARVNATFSAGEISLRRAAFPSGNVDPLEYPLDELLFTHHFARNSAMEVHACGISDETGHGYLFVGESGAGKSTTARLWRATTQATVLSDDRVILRAEGDQIWMYGTPWHGEACLSAAVGVRLDAIFFLRQAEHCSVTPVPDGRACAQLIAATFAIFHDPDLLTRVLAFTERVLRCVPCFDYGFLPDHSAVVTIRARQAEDAFRRAIVLR